MFILAAAFYCLLIKFIYILPFYITVHERESKDWLGRKLKGQMGKIKGDCELKEMRITTEILLISQVSTVMETQRTSD
jgi:hypothetical protein